jgi:hypothetical protein
MPKKRTLRFWNGGIYPYRGEHGYVAAYSRADAVRLINNAVGWRMVSDKELKEYWSECWGNPMEGITPERGFWTQGAKFDDPVKRII